MRRFLCILLLLTAGTLPADVFTLWPVRKTSGGAAAGNILNGTFKQQLHKERLIVNGVAMEMEVAQADIHFDTLLAQLKRSLKQEDFTVRGSTVRVGYPISRNRVERWLLVRNNDRQTTLFHLIAPAKLPPPENWPRELPPLPAGAEVSQTLSFPKRNGILGSFRNAHGDKRMILRQMTRYLEGDGWIAVGAESSVTRDSGGDLFIRTRNGRELLWVAAGDNGSGSCYYRKSN